MVTICYSNPYFILCREFCHSTEQGTVWDNTYEEQDSTLKGSFVIDQNSEGEMIENIIYISL